MISNHTAPLADEATVDHLHQRIASLEAQLHERAQQPNNAADLYFEALHSLDLGVIIYNFENLDDFSSITTFAANPASTRFVGIDLSAHLGKSIADLFPIENADIQALLAIYADVVRSGQKRSLGEMAFEVTSLNGSVAVGGVYSIQVIPLANQHVCLLFENLTERKQAEAALMQAKLQEEIIRVQDAALAELSTPLLAVGGGVVVMPLVGSIDSRRAGQVMERLLEGVSAANARAVILDITGIPIVDTQVANAFLQAAQAVKLLGARVILTGIRPEVAQTLVGLGVDLSGITTRGTLENGITEALNRRATAATGSHT